MAKSLSKQISDIKDDVNNICKKFTKELSKQVVDDLTTVFIDIVDNFYSAYPNPEEYIRTHNLYNAIIPQAPIEISKRGYNSGIVVGSFNMYDNYNISPDNVFNLFWKGVRGLPKVGTRILDNGDVWHNPTWVSKYGEYENVFRTQVVLGSYVSKEGTPQQIMQDIIEHWGEASGILACDKIYEKIKRENKA